MMTKRELTFTFKTETKGTFRFEEEGVDNVVGSLYVKKKFMEKPPTKETKVKLTIEVV